MRTHIRINNEQVGWKPAESCGFTRRLCVITNDELSVVDVVVPAGYPEITENPTPTWKTVQKDAEATLTCSASGVPVPTISWLKNFVPVDVSDPRISVLPSGTVLL